ncbi:MAG: DUF3784 domain-containing protein [Candidatus Heimdallarchaeaceae archaeon]|jgi:hypothetical protein
MEVYVLIAGIILFILGFLMIFGQPSFILARYETFQKIIRRKEISVDKEGLSKFYSILFFISGTPLLIGAIIGLIRTDMDIWIFIWLFIAVAIIGVIGILYCNISNKFIKTLE